MFFGKIFFFNENYKGLLSIGYIDKKQKLQPLKFI
jgi:hypothetical protein